jgi:two-component system response regulator ResD
MILIADDQDDVRSILAMLLAEEGYSVVEAVDGQAALELALASAVHLIVLDLAMPRLTGPAFCRAYRERGGLAPIILISAAPPETLMAAVASCGAVGSIRKPFEIEEALELIEQHAGRPT